jgi:hypothetical protein
MSKACCSSQNATSSSHPRTDTAPAVSGNPAFGSSDLKSTELNERTPEDALPSLTNTNQSRTRTCRSQTPPALRALRRAPFSC